MNEWTISEYRDELDRRENRDRKDPWWVWAILGCVVGALVLLSL